MMQAIVETLFDTVYLIFVVTIGILMIRGSRAVWLDGGSVGGGRFFPPSSPRSGSLHNGAGKLYGSSGAWKMDHFGDDDGFLCAAVLCLEAAVPDQGQRKSDRRCVCSGRRAHCFVHDASEPVAQCRSAPFLGHLPQHSFCFAGPSDSGAVLPQRKEMRGSGVPLDVADHCAELRLLYPGGAVGGCHSAHWDADDP